MHRARARQVSFGCLRKRKPSTIWNSWTSGRGDGSGHADDENPHPHAKVPVLKDGDETVFERIAICLYVTDEYPAAKLGPQAGDTGRGEFLTLLAYYAGVIEPALHDENDERRAAARHGGLGRGR